MKKYIGTKIIKARPMKLGAYNEYQGWKIPENEDPERPGFLVGYPDAGGKFNGPLESGCEYLSYSPETVFCASYRELQSLSTEGKDYAPHQVRVLEEKMQLDEKLGDLVTFMKVPFFATLPMEEQERLRSQLRSMKDYSDVLAERIESF